MTKPILEKPPKFLEPRVRVVTPADVPHALAVCAGWEEGVWRAEALARHLCRWIPEFALRYGEFDNLSAGTMLEMTRRAALKIYTTENFKSRGEFGELMLHAIIRHEFGTEPAISKIYFKDSANDTVKGFDCVHVSETGDGELVIWLGEAKFYTRINQAVSAAAADLRDHLDRDYLRSEFALVCDKLDSGFPLSGRIRDALRDERPLDEIVDALRIPVLLAYNSTAVGSHESVCAEYEQDLEAEVAAIRDRLVDELGRKVPPRSVTIEVVLLPVSDKQTLLRLLDQELRAWQGRT